MASLAFVTKEVRTGLKYGAIGIACIAVLFIVIRGLIFVKEAIFPSKLPPPKQEYGILPKIINDSPEAIGIQYRINTVDGVLPILPDRVDVYKLIQPEPDFIALNTAKSTLRTANFSSEPIKISDTIYQWNQDTSGVNIQYDIVSKNFSITSNYLDNPDLASSSLMPGPEKIKTDVNIFLGNVGAFREDLDYANSEVTYLELRDGNLIEANNLGSAKYARINIQQYPINEIPIVYSSPTESNISFVISYARNTFSVIDGHYFHYIPESEQKSDYTIKTVDQAYLDLQNGKAQIFNPNNLKVVDLTDVHVKYYLNKNTNVFLQPVIVFEGIDFVAYVDAIPEPPTPTIPE